MPRQRQRDRWRRFGPLLGLTVVAHAAVLALPLRPPAPVHAAAPLALQARLIEHLQPPPQALPAAASPAVRDAQAPAHALEPPLAVPASPRADDAQEAPAAPPSAVHEETVRNSDGWSLPGMASDDDRFVARSLLAIAPAPLTPVLIEYPASFGSAERYSGELTLFIDERGVVVRIRAEGEPLPAALEEAARRAFMTVRFSPGEMAEHGVVKSRIRVEVVFEGGPSAPAG